MEKKMKTPQPSRLSYMPVYEGDRPVRIEALYRRQDGRRIVVGSWRSPGVWDAEGSRLREATLWLPELPVGKKGKKVRVNKKTQVVLVGRQQKWYKTYQSNIQRKFLSWDLPVTVDMCRLDRALSKAGEWPCYFNEERVKKIAGILARHSMADLERYPTLFALELNNNCTVPPIRELNESQLAWLSWRPRERITRASMFANVGLVGLLSVKTLTSVPKIAFTKLLRDASQPEYFRTNGLKRTCLEVCNDTKSPREFLEVMIERYRLQKRGFHKSAQYDHWHQSLLNERILERRRDEDVIDMTGTSFAARFLGGFEWALSQGALKAGTVIRKGNKPWRQLRQLILRTRAIAKSDPERFDRMLHIAALAHNETHRPMWASARMGVNEQFPWNPDSWEHELESYEAVIEALNCATGPLIASAKGCPDCFVGRARVCPFDYWDGSEADKKLVDIFFQRSLNFAELMAAAKDINPTFCVGRGYYADSVKAETVAGYIGYEQGVAVAIVIADNQGIRDWGYKDWNRPAHWPETFERTYASAVSGDYRVGQRLTACSRMQLVSSGRKIQENWKAYRKLSHNQKVHAFTDLLRLHTLEMEPVVNPNAADNDAEIPF